jgi:hypothetical protein
MIEEMRPASRDQKRTPAQVRETRECLKQAAIELGGHWAEKQDHTLQPAPDVGIDFSKVPTEVLEASLAKMKEARAMLIEAAPGSVLRDLEPGPDNSK